MHRATTRGTLRDLLGLLSQETYHPIFWPPNPGWETLGRPPFCGRAASAEEITLWYYNPHFWRSYEMPICRPFRQLFADGRWCGSANEAYDLDGAFCGATQRRLF